jgi:hypothetical protein
MPQYKGMYSFDCGLACSESVPGTKESLQADARRFSDRQFRPTRENMYDGWEQMQELVRRGLFIHKKLSKAYVKTGIGHPDQFWLSQIGRGWAEIARQQHEESGGSTVSFQSAPATLDVAAIPQVRRGERDTNAARYLERIDSESMQITETLEDDSTAVQNGSGSSTERQQ